MPKMTFEQNMEALGRMSPGERDAKIAELTRMCICPGCPVQKSLALRWDYYCLKGSGREQAGIR